MAYAIIKQDASGEITAYKDAEAYLAHHEDFYANCPEGEQDDREMLSDANSNFHEWHEDGGGSMVMYVQIQEA